MRGRPRAGLLATGLLALAAPAAAQTDAVLELVRRGYDEGQIAKLWGGNLLRVLEECERIGRRLRGEGT